MSGRLRGQFYSADGKERGGQLRLVVVADEITYLSSRGTAHAVDKVPGGQATK